MSSTESNSVSGWIADLRRGEGRAASELWKRFSERVVQFARRELRDTPRRGLDEEDIALSVFDSVFRAVSNGRYAYLRDRTQLWRLLVTITRSKAIDLKRYERTAKRGGQKRAHAIERQGLLDMIHCNSLQCLAPTPVEAAELADQLNYLLGLLRDENLRVVAQYTLEGYSTVEIAQHLGVVDRTVRRKLAIIRETWECAAAEAGNGAS